jgi:hypothetical protein
VLHTRPIFHPYSTAKCRPNVLCSESSANAEANASSIRDPADVHLKILNLEPRMIMINMQRFSGGLALISLVITLRLPAVEFEILAPREYQVIQRATLERGTMRTQGTITAIGLINRSIGKSQLLRR